MKYIAKRILSGLSLIVGLTIVTFFLVRWSPGDPAARAYDMSASRNQLQDAREQLGLDKPLVEQFADWIAGFVRGDWGESYSTHRPVTEILREKLPNTLLLTLPALIVQIVFGGLIGIFQARKEDSLRDRTLSFATLTLYALPTFWVALILVMIFAQLLGWLPSSQIHSFSYQQLSFWGKIMDRLSHLILPLLSMSLVSVAVTARYIRNCLIDVQKQRYILAARARGLDEKIVIWRHALKNVLVPLITVIGQHLPVLIGSSVVIELIFSWPGMGRLMITSSLARDYPVIIACTFVMSLLVVFGNLIVDLLSAWIDPRIRFEN